MAEFFDENGNKVEAYTMEEIEAKIEEEREAAIEEANINRQEEIDNLNLTLEQKEEELRIAQEELRKERDKEKNLGGQRKVIESKEEEIKNLKKDIEELKMTSISKIADIEKKFNEEKINSVIDKITEGNKELKDKVKFYYENFKGEPKDDNELMERVRNAYIIATGGQQKFNLTGEIISSAGEPPIGNLSGSKEKLSPEALRLAKEMGITDQDLKKYKLI